MELLESILLGIVQGLTEFLPVSSSGHLVLLEKAGLGKPDLFFNVMLHTGSLFAVILFYRKNVLSLVRHPFRNGGPYYVWAMIPTGIMALLFDALASDALEGKYLPLGFMITAAALVLAECFRNSKMQALSIKNSILTGVFQGIALFPGVSRSGLTLSALTLSGVERKTAADFCFMLSIPVIALSAVYELITVPFSEISVNPLNLAVGTAASFLSSLVAVRFMTAFVKKHRLYVFSFYLVIAAAISFLTIRP